MEVIKYDDLVFKFDELVKRLNKVSQDYLLSTVEDDYDEMKRCKEEINGMLDAVSHNVIKLLYRDSAIEFDEIFSSKSHYYSAEELGRHITAQTKMFFVEKYLSKEEVKDILRELKNKENER